MALTFMPGAVSVGHRDGNKLNNQLSNLFPKDTHWQAPSVPIDTLNALLNEFNSGSRRRGEITYLATKYSVPWLVARRFVAKHSPSTTIEPTTLAGEEWRPIPNYEGLYEVSCMGRVKRTAHESRVGWLKEKLVNGRKTSDGYHVTPLTANGKTQGVRVHRAVAMAFIPNLDNLPEVNHLDGNKLNNHVSNLEWATSFDNKVHAWKTGLYPRKSKHSSPTSN